MNLLRGISHAVQRFEAAIDILIGRGFPPGNTTIKKKTNIV